MGLEAGAIAAIASVAIPALIGVGKELFGGGTSAGDVSQAGAQKMANMQQAAGAYGAYRPDAANARMKAMSQQLSAFQGAGNMMQAMYGGGGSAPGAGGTYKEPELPPGWMNQWDPVSGTYKPIPGGPKPGWPQTIGGMTFNSQAEYDKWRAESAAWSSNKYTPTNPTGNPTNKTPIIPPGGGDGSQAGSTGPMFTGDNPLAAMLAAADKKKA